VALATKYLKKKNTFTVYCQFFVNFQDIAKPSSMEWSSPLEALEAALDLEKRVNESLLTVHKQAGDRHDAHLEDFLENQFLDHQVFSSNQ
jgi:ferritin heavy chain